MGSKAGLPSPGPKVLGRPSFALQALQQGAPTPQTAQSRSASDDFALVGTATQNQQKLDGVRSLVDPPTWPGPLRSRPTTAHYAHTWCTGGAEDAPVTEEEDTAAEDDDDDEEKPARAGHGGTLQRCRCCSRRGHSCRVVNAMAMT